MNLAEEAGYICYLAFQELVEHGHISLFPKENVVGKVLENLSNNH